MKNLIIFIFALTLTSCSVNAQQSADAQKLTLTGSALPAIRHVTEMKITGDTLWFVYETEAGFGQRFLRKAVIDRENNTLDVGPDLGRTPDGYFRAYMPYPVDGGEGGMLVVNQEDGEILRVDNDTALIRTKKYILSGNSSLPFPMSQYVQDITLVSPDNYVFIGREPNGGEQYAMAANIADEKSDIIRKIAVSQELCTWMPNAGELEYSHKYNRMAFAYRLHPAIEIFAPDGKLIKRARVGEDTFNPATLGEADFEEMNTLHFVDLTTTPEHIFALHWNCRYADTENVAPTIFKLDWDGSIVDRLINVPTPLYKIAATVDGTAFIGWTGRQFVLLHAR